jgi:hypothetical protein
MGPMNCHSPIHQVASHLGNRRQRFDLDYMSAVWKFGPRRGPDHETAIFD